jgi:hypothetical protein
LKVSKVSDSEISKEVYLTLDKTYTISLWLKSDTTISGDVNIYLSNSDKTWPICILFTTRRLLLAMIGSGLISARFITTMILNRMTVRRFDHFFVKFLELLC